MNSMAEINEAIRTRAAVRISDRNGYHKGVTGIAMGYSAAYGSIKVGFVDSDGNYAGESTTVAAENVELIVNETPEEASPRYRDNRPDVEALFMADLIREDGSVWSFKSGSVFINGKGSALPRGLMGNCKESDYGEWI